MKKYQIVIDVKSQKVKDELIEKYAHLGIFPFVCRTTFYQKGGNKNVVPRGNEFELTIERKSLEDILEVADSMAPETFLIRMFEYDYQDVKRKPMPKEPEQETALAREGVPNGFTKTAS